MTLFNKPPKIQTTPSYLNALLNKVQQTQSNNTQFLSTKTEYKF
jgi:hypothetical protein